MIRLLLLFPLFGFGQAIPPDSSFVRLIDYAPEVLLDMRYATSENFLNEKVYDCGECYMRYSTAKALASATQEAMSKGFRIKIFDCYRPLDVQRKMWKIVPNPIYVADPAKGSIHNRGGAIDLTLVDSAGRELDMGTPFDHFGPEAAHSYKKLPRKIRRNRRMLREIMTKSGFEPFASEWWHYDLKGSRTFFSVANFKWRCP